MENETEQEERQELPWILDFSCEPGSLWVRDLGPACWVGEAEVMQVPGGTPGEEAVLFRVEVVEKGGALEEGEVVGIGQQF